MWFALPAAALFFQGTVANAQPTTMTKDQCIDAHSRGQTLRDGGKLTGARELFLKCAQSACPALIQGDCARFADEMTRTVPSVNFVARDARGNDVVDTTVFVDDVQVPADQGKSLDIDPGEHAVRFVHQGKKLDMKIVVHEGERDRLVVGTIPDDVTKPIAPPVAPTEPQPAAPARRPNIGPWLVLGGGAASLIAGGILTVVGFRKVPSECRYWSKDCAAPPGSPSFDDAASGARLVNAGLIVGGIGLVAIAGGITWQLLKPTEGSESSKKDTGIMPWGDFKGGGLSWKGRF